VDLVSVCLPPSAHATEVEDLAIAILRHPGGTLSQVTASLVHHGEEQELMFQGERAGLWIPWKIRAGGSLENGFPVEDTGTVRLLQARYDSLETMPYEGHEGQIDDFLSAIESGRPPFVDGVEGRKTIELITAIYKASVEGRQVRLPLDPADPSCTAAGILASMPRFHQKKRIVENLPSPQITLGRDPGR
jgi:UDP-N-acetyl-2-amino-2-deoxyglucuronate dehydrogenase